MSTNDTSWGETFRSRYAPDEILPGLFQGGTEDEDVVMVGAPRRARGNYPFDVVVTLYADANPAPWGVEELRFGFPDMDLRGPDTKRVVRLARAAYRRWQSGDRVLIRCQAGLNRSGLVTALVLMLDGFTADEAIELIRERRDPDALFNTDFVRWLRRHAREHLSASSDFQAA